MFDVDLLVAFLFMSVLFLRQITILKQPNKINYAPLMLSVGVISSVVHFILHPDTANVILLIRESLIPLLVAFILYVIMNILHQTQVSLNSRMQDEFIQVLVSEITQLKEFIAELEQKMKNAQELSVKTQEEVRNNFINDIKALDTILQNQNEFIKKIKEMQEWHKEVNKAFTYFSEVQLPELDEVVHKHIDILRVAEQDHYNKTKQLLEKAVQSRFDMAEDLDDLKTKLEGMRAISSEIARDISSKTIEKLSSVTKNFEGELLSLKSHAEALKTSLYEGDATLSGVKTQSEMIMKQMVLSSKKMDELQEKHSVLNSVFFELKEIIQEIEIIKTDYIKAQAELSKISRDIQHSKDTELIAMKEKIDDLSEKLSKKIDESLEKLHEHYHITSEDISQSVKVLAKKAQLQKGYTELD